MAIRIEEVLWRGQVSLRMAKFNPCYPKPRKQNKFKVRSLGHWRSLYLHLPKITSSELRHQVAALTRVVLAPSLSSLGNPKPQAAKPASIRSPKGKIKLSSNSSRLSKTCNINNNFNSFQTNRFLTLEACIDQGLVHLEDTTPLPHNHRQWIHTSLQAPNQLEVSLEEITCSWSMFLSKNSSMHHHQFWVEQISNWINNRAYNHISKLLELMLVRWL